MTAREIAQALRCGRSGCGCGREIKPSEFITHCPRPESHAHGDRTPSLTVKESGGKILVKDFGGCSQEAVIEALKARDLWPSRNGDRLPAAPGGGLTLADFAAAKKLDPAYLARQGVTQATGRDGKPYVIFHYRDRDGKPIEAATRFRFSMGEKPKSKRGGKPALYGLWRLTDFRPGGEVILSEGESDTLTFWSYDLPAVGLPGKGLTKTISPALFKGFSTVYVWQEPDAPELPGKIAARLPGITVKALIPPAGVKDISEAHCQGLNVPELVAGLMAQAQTVEPAQARQKGGGDPGEGARPVIIVNDRHLRDSTAEAIEALKIFNDPPQIFLRTGSLVRVKTDETERTIIEPLGIIELRHFLTQAADFVRIRRDSSLVSPPKDITENILAAPNLDFPPLQGIVETPILRADGSLLSNPGYDLKTGLYYRPMSKFTLPVIPENLTPEDANRAACFIADNLLADFPFADESSKTHVFAALLTPVVRHAISGPVPLSLFDAPQAGTGKTLLSELIGLTATGRPSSLIAPPIKQIDDAEWGKIITSALLNGTSFICFDNLSGPLKSPSLAMAITASIFSNRILGKNELVDLPVRVSWLANGNNVLLGGDLLRRCYWVRMDAKMSKPWERQSFKHKDLKKWVVDSRGKLVASLLIMALAWFKAGKPKAESPILGSFEEWCKTIGGILAFSQIKGFLSNLGEMHESTDIEGPEWEAFLAAWLDTFGDRPVTTADIYEEISSDNSSLKDALPTGLLAAYEKSTMSFASKIGKALTKRQEVHYGDMGYHLVRPDKRDRKRWIVLTY